MTSTEALTARAARLVDEQRSTASKGLNDQQLVIRANRGLEALETPNVFITNVDVEEAAQLAFVVKQPIAKPGALAVEVGENVAQRDALGRELSAVGREASQRIGDFDDRHAKQLSGLLSRFPGARATAGLITPNHVEKCGQYRG